MAFQTATNPDTGERFALIDNEWVPFSKTASNPDTGEKFGLIKNQWMPLAVKAAEPPKAAEPATKPTAEPAKAPDDQSVLRQIADVPLKYYGGVATGFRMISDAFGADSAASKNLRSVEDFISDLYSAQSKKDSREVARIMDEIKDKGLWDQVTGGLKAAAVAPLDLVTNALGTSAPGILAGLLTVFTGGAAPMVGTAVGLGTGAVMGAGTIKGSIYDATKDILSQKTKMTPEQIEAVAIKAQEYKGENLDMIMLGAAITAFGSTTGVEPVLARQLAKQIATRTAQTEAEKAAGRAALGTAVRETTARETAKAAERGMVKHGVITAGKEFLGEGAEGAQEQAAQNLAQQRLGFDVPVMQGVVSQGVLEGTTGALLGGFGGGREARRAKRELVESYRESSGEGEDLRGEFTTAGTDSQPNAPQPEAHHLALINSALDQNGNPLVGSATPPAASTPAATPPSAPTAATPTEQEQIWKKALTYLDELSADPNKRPNASKLKGLVKELGIDVPAGEGFNTRAIQAIQMHFGLVPSNTETVSSTEEAPSFIVDYDQAETQRQIDDISGILRDNPRLSEKERAPLEERLDELLSRQPEEGTLAFWEGHPVMILSKPTRNTGYEAGVPYTSVKFQNANGTFEGEGSTSQYVRTSEITTQGAPSGTDTTTGGTSAAVAAPAITTTNAPPAPVDTTGDLGRTGAAVSTDTTGEKVQLSSLSQETQDEINRRRDEVQTLIEDGKPSKLIQNKLGFLNRLEDTHGVERFVPTSDGLPAKRTAFTSVQKLIDQGKQAVASFINRTPAYEGRDLEGAMRLADRYDRQTEQERQQGLEESEGKEPKNIKVSSEIVEEYNATREEVNKNADEQNQKRKQLVDNLDKLHKEREAAEAKLENENINDPANEAHISYLDQQIAAAEAELQKHGGVKNKLPNWEKELTPTEKEVYLDQIRNNTIEEHNKAAQALLEHRREQGTQSREKEGSLDRTEQRLAKIYDDNRKATGKFFGFTFPKWSDLSPPAKAVYLRELAGKALTGHQQDNAFAQLAKHLISKNTELSAARVAEENKRIEERKKVIQERSREEEKRNKERLAKYERQSLGAARTSEFVPNNVVQAVKNNDLAGVLSGIASALDKTLAPHRKIYKQLANLTSKLGLKTKIQMVDSLPDGDLAIYDPATDTIKVTPEGMTYTTILHEVVHAASVRVLNHYMEGRTNLLTPSQIKAAEHILKIMKETQEALGEYHPEAYANPYEFLAYSLTDKMLQADLHEQGIEYGLYSFLGQQREDIISIMPDKKSAWSEFKRAIAGIVGYKPGQLKSFNFVLELNAAFEDVLSVPTEPIYLNASLSAKQAPRGSQRTRGGDMTDADARAQYRHSERERPQSTLSKIWENVSTIKGARNLAKKAVDRTYPVRSWELRNSLGNLIHYSGDMFNAVSTALDLSTGEKAQFITHYLDQPLTELKSAFGSWMKDFGKSFDDAHIDFHMYAEAFAETERRLALWVMSVPLSQDNKGPKAILENGKMISAAERRTHIVGDKSKGIPGLIDQVALSTQQKQQLWSELTHLANNYADVAGYSPRDIKIDPTKPNAAEGLKMWNSLYTAVGLDEKAVQGRMDHFNALSNAEKEAILKIFSAAKKLSEATKELNRIGNYWSFPVTNITDMYNYQYYMPFKGLSKSETEDMLDPNTVGYGKAVQEIEHETLGRFSLSDDPLAVLMQDAYKAANRAAIRNYTLAIKNALPKSENNPNGTGVLAGEVKAHIPFAERKTARLEQYKGGPYVFHYNPDGSIDVLQISEKDGMLDAIRYSFKKPSPFLDALNDVVGWIGANHTRYNFNFAPNNFVIDSMTNAWNMGGGMMGPLAAPKYLGMVAAKVLSNGLGKAYEVALYNTESDIGSQKVMLDMAKDPFVRDMMDMIKIGGKTVYIDSMSLRSNIKELKSLEKSHWVVTKWKQFQALVDTWSTMFELTSRTAAYQIFKDYYYQENLKKNMSPDEALQGAKVRAAADTKNLTNFEKVGEWGRGMGAMYMFIRPSAQSASRAIETVAPAMTPLSWAEQRMPKAVAENPAASAAYRENYKKLQWNSRIMTSALTGFGIAMYYMAVAMSPDDEWERNSVKNDDMSQWTRKARFHIPDSWGWGKDVIINVPWGFGLGAFPAMGAQMAGMYSGNTSVKEGLGNIMGSILTDSFLPIPISRIPITEHPFQWLFDSIAPSILRPGFEYAMNMNGIGQAINSATQRRFGAAFTGGDKIPQIYKDFSEWLYNKTQGKINLPPNSAYFLVNSYIDGWGKLGELAYSWTDLAKDKKEFKAKTDLPIVGSFFGSKSNVDAREYGKVEDKIKDLEERNKTLRKTSAEAYADFRADNPAVDTIIHTYHQQKTRLDRLHARANEIRVEPALSPKEKQEMLRLNIIQQNMLKHEIVERFKMYGVEP